MSLVLYFQMLFWLHSSMRLVGLLVYLHRQILNSFTFQILLHVFRHLLGRNYDGLPSSYRTIIVPFKESLNRRSLKHENILFNLLHIIIFPIVFLIRLGLVKVISVLGWFVRGIQLFLKQTLPVKLPHPNMLLYFRWSIQTKSVSRFSLQTFVDEVCSFKRPSLRQFMSFN